jgi:PadR family transcriptional regulator, regulatory protein PadR
MKTEGLVLGEFEQMVLLAVLQAGDNAYGISVHDQLRRRTGRRVALGAVYITLDRLEKKGLLSSRLSEPVAERGGRARRCYAVTRRARAALRASRRALMNLWDGLRLAEE